MDLCEFLRKVEEHPDMDGVYVTVKYVPSRAYVGLPWEQIRQSNWATLAEAIIADGKRVEED